MNEELWTISDLEMYFKMTRRSVNRMMFLESFPKARRLYANARPRWVKHEIIQWAENQTETV